MLDILWKGVQAMMIVGIAAFVTLVLLCLAYILRRW